MNNRADLMELAEAQARILACVQPLPVEEIPLGEAAGRVLAEPVFAGLDLPPFDNSAMDGYALRSAEVSHAAPERPAVLKIQGTAAAGANFPGRVEAGTCVQVFTGSVLPDGADAVVMQEDTQRAEEDPSTLRVLDAVKPGENVRRRGEDVRRGAKLLDIGRRLRAAELSLLAAVGLPRVNVSRRPVVALLSTGSELREPGQSLSPGQIYESNRVALKVLAEQAGAQVRCLPLVPDTRTAISEALRPAWAEADAVVTTGGASVGELDFVKQAFQDLGGTIEFWRVSMRPGKPFVFGRWGDKLLFGLPGNPVSAFVTFLLLVRPALLGWQGASQVQLPRHRGVLQEALANPDTRRHFVRVRVDPAGRVRLAGTQASHVLTSLAAADGLVDLPPASTCAVGSQVEVMRWDEA
jgi:molybdopterin molybdotransferase